MNFAPLIRAIRGVFPYYLLPKIARAIGNTSFYRNTSCTAHGLFYAVW